LFSVSNITGNPLISWITNKEDARSVLLFPSETSIKGNAISHAKYFLTPNTVKHRQHTIGKTITVSISFQNNTLSIYTNTTKRGERSEQGRQGNRMTDGDERGRQDGKKVAGRQAGGFQDMETGSGPGRIELITANGHLE